MASVPYKNITSIISTRQEDATFTTVNDSGLTYTLCDRTDLTSKEANYFISFRIPHDEDLLGTGSTLSLQNPQLQQMNVDRIVICPIPREDYNEIIDGRSITFTVPQTGSTTKTVVSSTYTELTKYQSSTLLGNNVAFLFSDDINLPRTGTTSGGVSSFLPRTTWNVSPFVNRPQAHAYSDLAAADINTDQRPWSGVNLAVQVDETYPTTTNQGYNYDIPVGYIALDKGFLVLTHPDIVDNIPWDEGFDIYTNVQNSGTTNVYFTGGSAYSQVTFNDININFRTSVVCLALPTEFVFSSNPSWNLAFNIQELDNGTNGFDPVQVTEIGLYNKNNELIAVAKLDRPVEKTYTNLITFNLDIDV
ncbi:MAG: hypothetical protein AABY15_04180 [Nanoarchaeota archaeon]